MRNVRKVTSVAGDADEQRSRASLSVRPPLPHQHLLPALLVGAGLLSASAQLSAETPDPAAPELTEARAHWDDVAGEPRSGPAAESSPGSAEESPPGSAESPASRAAEESPPGRAEESPGAPTAPTTASAFLAELAPSLGNEPGSRLQMTFEVTFMKIDVADVEARLPAQTAALIEPIVRRGKRNDDTDEEIAALLLDPDTPILLTLAYLRDADHGRFSSGIRSSMEKAAASGEITEEERLELTDLILEASAPLEETGVSKGGVFAHFIEGEVVRTVYLGPEGDVRLDTSHSNAALGRALRASWFSRESRFRKKLIRSLYE